MSRQRLIERAGRRDRNMLLVAGMVGAILTATALFRGPWALLPLAVMTAGMVLGPLAIRGGGRIRGTQS